MLGVSLRHRGDELLALPQDLDTYARTGAATRHPLPASVGQPARGLRLRGRRAPRRPHRRRGRAPVRRRRVADPRRRRRAPRLPRAPRRRERRRRVAHRRARLRRAPGAARRVPVPAPARGRDRAAAQPCCDSARPSCQWRGRCRSPSASTPTCASREWSRARLGGRAARARPHRSRRSRPAVRHVRGPRRRARAAGRRGASTTSSRSARSRSRSGSRGGGRRLAVEFRSGYPYAQVFAPAGEEFICFEPMTAPVNALRSGEGLRFAEPGRPFTAEWILEVRNADAGGWTVAP